MKKILSFALAATTAIQLCISGISVSATELALVKKTYSIEQLNSFQPPKNECSTVNTRTFGVAIYQNGGKTYAYLPTKADGVKVYDVSNPKEVGQPIQTVTEIQTGDRSYSARIEVCNSKLYAFSSKMSSKLHCMEIGSDGKIDTTTDKTTSFTPLCVDTDGNFVFASQNNSKFIHVLDATSENPITSVGTYTDSGTGTVKNIRAMKVRKLDNDVYRIAYMIEWNDGTYEITVVDYNSLNKTFTQVCKKSDEQWKDHTFSTIAFIGDAALVVSAYASNEVDYYTVDFANCITTENAVCTITKSQTETAQTYNAFMQTMTDGEIAAWHNTSYIKDFTGASISNIASATVCTVVDAAMIGDVNSTEGATVYLAADDKVIIENVKRASVTEKPYKDDTVIGVDCETPQSFSAESMRTSCTATVGNKTVVYGIKGNNSSSSLYAYDITNASDGAATKLGSEITVNNAKDSEMCVKNGHLIFANGNNVQINKLNDDGSIGNQVFTHATGNSVASIRVMDNLLFVGSMNKSNGVTVYDISDPSNTKLLGTITTDADVRSIDIEKISNIGYRVYILTKASIDGVSTLKLAINDVTYALGSYSAETVYEAALPKYDTLGWPGYNSYAAYDTGKATVVKAGYVAVECEGKGRFVIDATTSANPQVVYATSTTSGDYRQRKVRLDSTKVVEVNNNADGVYVIDYTNPAAPTEIAKITGISGKGASIVENYLYTTKDNTIQSLKLYDYKVSYGDIVFNKTIVGNNDTKASVTVTNNTQTATTPILIVALYSNDNKLVDIAVTNTETVEPNTSKSVSATISSGKIDGNASYYYFKAMLWDNLQSITPIKESVTLGTDTGIL